MDLKTYVAGERGRAASLASALGISPVMVSQWVSGLKKVPAERCPAIERATGGAVLCEELRPDVEWQVLREQAAPEPPSTADQRSGLYTPSEVVTAEGAVELLHRGIDPPGDRRRS